MIAGIDRRRPSTARHVLAVVGAYAVLFTWLHARPLVEDAYLAGTDLYDYYLPIFLSPITIWSTFELSGLPAFADSQNASFYPLNLIFGRLLPSWTAYIVSAYVLAASFTYAYIYNRTRSVLGAAVGGLAYGMSEAMLERLEHLSIVHTIAWLPLIALAIDRLRGRWHSGWVAVGAFAVGNCLLAGHTQPAIYIIYVCGLYAVIGAVAGRAGPGGYAATATLFATGGLLAAVSAVPLLEASGEAVRQTVSFGQFVSHSNTPAQMLSFFVPAIVHEGREAPTYVGLAAVVFALLAFRDARRHWPIVFWWCVAIVALLAGAGESTPVARWLHEVPLYDRFRVVARHLVLSAFALSVLAGFGVAAASQLRVPRRAAVAASLAVLAAVLLAAGAVTRWPDRFPTEAVAQWGWTAHMPGNAVGAQVALAVVTMVACVLLTLKPSRLSGGALAGLLLADLTTAQPYRITLSGMQAPVVPSAALQPSVHARALRSALARDQQRLLAPAGVTTDTLVPGAFARLWQIPVAGAYGAIQTQRYSQLAAMGTTGAVDYRLLADDDAAIDVLAVKYVVVDRRDLAPSDRFTNNGVEWGSARLDMAVGPEECGQRHPRSATFSLPPHVNVARLALVSALRCSEDVAQGAEVGTLSIVDAAGSRHDVPLRAGIETADASFASAEGRHRGRHLPAEVFESYDGAYGYLARVDVPRPLRGARLEIRLHGTAGWMQIQRLSVMDESGATIPIGPLDLVLFNPDRWRVAATLSTSPTSDRATDEDEAGEEEIVVFENRRARPRAWLAREVVPLTEAQLAIAVHHSVLPDGRRFDPAAMALVDAEAGNAASAQVGDGSARAPSRSSSALVSTQSVEPGRIRVNVASTSGGFLVLSESYYPGWRARVGNRDVPVMRTNLALQGVSVPPGEHLVTFEFSPLSLRAGAAASIIALVALLGLGTQQIRGRRRDAARALQAGADPSSTV